ncbi:LysR family transcriptional regulator [Marinomonas sp. 2405UD68-3]|uniref:LysR family transcriptional regulator n=1 Tax=Marinomonas sp. 2405UD68-3 TaxID=3391835 RepID=UPI0039C9594B
MRHLKAFYIFHIAAESSSYSNAADTLHITHGAVSKQIKQLEEHLSQSLFYKQGRRMHLTKEGILLKQHTDIAFNALEVGVNKLKRTQQNHIEVSCEPTLTMRWLMPRLSNFYQSSGIDVRLSTAGGPIVLGENKLSMAIRRDDFEIPSHYKAHKLVDEWVGPVFAPEYWQKMKHNVEKVTLLHSKSRPEAWSDWSHNVKELLHLNQSNQYFEHFYFCLQAAADGLGAALGSYPLVMDDIEKGRLVAPFGFSLSKKAYVLLYQSIEPESNEAQFQQWLTLNMAFCRPEKIS